MPNEITFIARIAHIAFCVAAPSIEMTNEKWEFSKWMRLWRFSASPTVACSLCPLVAKFDTIKILFADRLVSPHLAFFCSVFFKRQRQRQMSANSQKRTMIQKYFFYKFQCSSSGSDVEHGILRCQRIYSIGNECQEKTVKNRLINSKSFIVKKLNCFKSIRWFRCGSIDVTVMRSEEKESVFCCFQRDNNLTSTWRHDKKKNRTASRTNGEFSSSVHGSAGEWMNERWTDNNDNSIRMIIV